MDERDQIILRASLNFFGKDCLKQENDIFVVDAKCFMYTTCLHLVKIRHHYHPSITNVHTEYAIFVIPSEDFDYVHVILAIESGPP